MPSSAPNALHDQGESCTRHVRSTVTAKWQADPTEGGTGKTEEESEREEKNAYDPLNWRGV